MNVKNILKALHTALTIDSDKIPDDTTAEIANDVQDFVRYGAAAPLKWVGRKLLPVGLNLINNALMSSGPAGQLVRSNPLTYWVEDVLNKDLKLRGRTFNQNDLTFLQNLELNRQARYAIEHSGNKKLNKAYFEKHPNDTIRIPLNAKAVYPALYGRPYGTTKDNGVLKRMFIPNQQIESIIGDAFVDVYKDGADVVDTYDFNEGQGDYEGNYSPYAILRRIAKGISHKNTDSDRGKNKWRINLYSNYLE